MGDRIEQAGQLAESARRLAATGDYAGAIERQRGAVALLDAELNELGSDEAFHDEARDTARRLSDNVGRLGGYLRREDRIMEATEAYDHGADLERRYRLPDSYNLTNAIVMRILADPSSLPQFAERIDDAAAQVEAQVAGPRRDQWWAYADLGLLSMLAGRIPDALRAYRKFHETGARRSDVRSVLNVLLELERKLQVTAPDIADGVRHAVAILESDR